MDTRVRHGQHNGLYGTFLRKIVCFLSMDQCQLQAIIVGILTVKDELGVI